jgi:N-glycosylase/DNA lyase
MQEAKDLLNFLFLSLFIIYLMKELVKQVKNVKKDKSRLISQRLKEFNKPRTGKELFKELCFCILTANFNAERAIKIQEEISDGFLTLPEKELSKKLKALGYRYPNIRAKFIVEARNKDIDMNRDWLVNNIKGLGLKEASHFLRNTGSTSHAIIDFHILDLLAKHGIEKPKTLSKKNYLAIEELLRSLCTKCNSNLAELDLCLWYLETGKILK